MTRFLYSLKAKICLNLGLWWQGESFADSEYRAGTDYFLLDSDGGVFGSHDIPTTHWFYHYGVGFGVLRNWWVIERQDSD